MADNLGPLDVYALAARKRRIADQYNLGTYRNQYERGAYENAFKFDLNDLNTQLQRQREKLPYAFGGRGIQDSGIYGQALANFGNDAASATNRLLQGHLDKLAGYTVGQHELDTIYQSALADIEEERNARRAAIAASIQGY